MRHLQAVDFSIYHHGCPASESTERFPSVMMKILSSNPYGKDRASALLYAGPGYWDELTRFLGYWRDHSAVSRLSLVEKSQKGVMFNVALKAGGGVTKAIVDNNAFFLTAVPVIGGIERWSILVEDEDKSSLFSRLDGVGVVKVNRVEKLKLDKEGLIHRSIPISCLSPKQLNILKAAIERGYFDCPRRIDSRQLAKQVGISQSTLLEHLRKAQSKILKEILHCAGEFSNTDRSGCFFIS